MPDHEPVFTDVAGHTVFDIDATRHATQRKPGEEEAGTADEAVDADGEG
jgi:hypothetical protein